MGTYEAELAVSRRITCASSYQLCSEKVNEIMRLKSLNLRPPNSINDKNQ
jgi:hypothetical protein